MKTKLYAKKTLSVFMAVMMLMSAWVFVPGEHNHASAYPDGAAVVAGANNTKIAELNSLNFDTGFTTVSGNFHGDNATTTASKGYFVNTLYSPHFPASNNNLSNSDAGAYFGDLGGRADGSRVWYPETTLIWDGVKTPQIGVLFDIDSNSNNIVPISNVYMASGANGLSFPRARWYAKSTQSSNNYYTHFSLNWILDNHDSTDYISTTSSNDYSSQCAKKGNWDIYGTYLQYTGGSFGSGSTYYKAITPTWKVRSSGTDYTGTTNKTIYVIDYVPLKNALAAVPGIVNDIKNNPGKYTTDSVSDFVEAAKKLVAAKPNNYINSSNNKVADWNTAVSAALTAWNSAKNLTLQSYRVTFIDKDGNDYYYTRTYGSSFDCASIASSLGTKIAQHNDQYHQTYKWDNTKYVSTVTDDVIINEVPDQLVAHSFGSYVQNADNHQRTCSVCGYVETKAHVEDKGTVDKEETCTEDGIKTYDCSVCGKADIRTVTINNIIGHSFTTDTVVKETGENGSHWKKCSRCDVYGWAGAVGNSEVHNWDKNKDGNVDAKDAENKASTCKEAGHEIYTCQVCGDKWTKTLELAAHKIAATAAKDVTTQCGVDGNYAFWTCTECNRVWKDAALTDELTDTTDADKDGIPDELEIKGNDHDFTGPYTPAANGTHYRQCNRCKAAYGLENAEGATEAHKYKAEVTKEATCTAEGEKKFTCELCRVSYTEKIDKIAHSMVKTDAVAPDCVNGGNNEYYSCTICKKYYKDADGKTETTVAAETLSKLNHTFITGEDVQHPESDEPVSAATCQTAAVYVKTCDRCGTQATGLDRTYTYGDPDTVNGHKFNGEVQKNADGTHSYKCTVANCPEYGSSVNCSYEVTVDVASTCRTPGHTTYVCKDCGNGYTETKDLDSNNHTGEGTKVIGNTEASCYYDGYTGYTYCNGCSAKLADGETIKADKNLYPHEEMKDYDAKAATCQADGWDAYRYCRYCDTYEIAKVTKSALAHKFTTYRSNGDGTHTAVCDTCAEGTEKAIETKDCTGGKANCTSEALCSVCKAVYGEIDSTNHTDIKTAAMVPATCQSEGTEAYRYCAGCNTPVDEIIPITMLEHIYGKWVSNGDGTHTKTCTTCDSAVAAPVVQTADCNGGTAYCNAKAVCADCKAAYGDYDAANHSTEANTLKDFVAATCQSEGFSGNYRYDCCDAIKVAGTATAKLDHKFDIEVEGSRKAATCIAKGEVTYKCSTCVESEGVTAATNKVELPIDAKNHASADVTVVGKKEATCETDGHTGDIYYSCCYDAEKTAAENKKALKEKGTVIKANGQHVYGDAVPEYMIARVDETKDDEGNVTSRTIVLRDTAPTYNEKVAARRADNKWYHAQVCTICYEITYTACYTYAHSYNCVDTDECEVCEGLCSLVDENKHDTLVEIEAVDATHTTDGSKAYYQCSGCGKYFLDDAGKKSFDPESAEGKALITISKDTVPCTGWEEEPYEEVAPTCGKDGYKKYRCLIEGCDKVKTEVIPATSASHVWSSDYKVIKEPTCHSVGYKVIKCANCDADKPNSTITIAATGNHDYDVNDDGIVDRNDAVITEGENCQKPGTLTYTCQNEGCKNTKTEDDTEGVSAHVFGDWVTTGGDCSSGIIQERVCGLCGVKEQQALTTDTHVLVVYIRVEPTPEKKGYVIYECKNCKIKTEPEELEYTGPEIMDEHIIDETQYRTVKEATCTKAEQREYTCIRCGKKLIMFVGELKPHYWLEQPAEVSTCEKAGHSAYYRCVICREERDRVNYEPLGHNDGDGNGKCDECNEAYYNNGQSTCGCICHKESGFMKIIYKIVNFFWKLFKINYSCSCGATHY